MTIATCPCCGYDLERLEMFRVGHLVVADEGAVVSWRGHRIKVTPQRGLLVNLLARCAGHVVTTQAVIEAVDSDSDDPLNMVKVLACRLRRDFCAIDPTFDRIETIWGRGLRWKDDGLVGKTHIALVA